MKAIVIVLIIMSCFNNMFAQRDNRISINAGEVVFTDWSIRVWFEQGLSYTHIWGKRYVTSVNVSRYQWLGSEGLDFTKLDIPEIKKYIETNASAGYYWLTTNQALEIHTGIGVSYRYRFEGFSSLYDVVATYWKHEIGGVIYINTNYMVTNGFSVGLYGFGKFYPGREELVNNGQIHKSPNVFSYGLSAGFHF
jgi:hypothetical protein